MRFIVVALVLLAGLKVWTQDRIYRSAMSDALVVAYRDRAAQSCFKATEPAGQGKMVKVATVAANPWMSSPTATIAIGNPRTDVALLDFDNPLWNVRYRHPHLVLAGSSAVDPACMYDVVVGVAHIAAR